MVAIHVALFSEDFNLQPLLTFSMGSEFRVTAEGDANRLQKLLSKDPADVFLLDLDTDRDTIRAQKTFYDGIKHLGIPVVALVDDNARSVAIDLLQDGLHSYCRKPPAIRELKALLWRASEYAVLRRQVNRYSGKTAAPVQNVESCHVLIGKSPEILAVHRLIELVADLNAHVLITGETGTGKELIARALHSSSRAAGPFVAVSCGAIPETLLESELFGHEKGAFTGATETRVGYFEQADRGTLLLDEIGDISLVTQVKLLRVLQQREFSRLGSGRPIPMRARVLFATHRNLSAMVSEGTFRLDLFYRLNVMTIKSPRLADHPEDIPLLANHFLQKYSELTNKPVDSIASQAMAVLETYEWPGNVRELENVIQTAIIYADNNVINAQDLPSHLTTHEATESVSVIELGYFDRLLRDYRQKIVSKAIEECKGNKSLAARNLNISRAYLHRLIRSAEVTEAVDDVCG